MKNLLRKLDVSVKVFLEILLCLANLGLVIIYIRFLIQYQITDNPSEKEFIIRVFSSGLILLSVLQILVSAIELILLFRKQKKSFFVDLFKTATGSSWLLVFTYFPSIIFALIVVHNENWINIINGYEFQINTICLIVILFISIINAFAKALKEIITDYKKTKE